MAGDISVKLGVDGEADFKSALTAINAEIKALDSGIKVAASSMDDMTSSEDAQSKKSKATAKAIEAYKKKLELLNERHSAASDRLEELAKDLQDAKEKYGENSAEAQKATYAYNKQRTVVANLQTQINKTETSINGLTDSTEDSGEAMTETEPKASGLEKSLGRLASVMTLKLAGQACKVAVKGLKDMAKALADAAGKALSLASAAGSYADELLTTSQVTGVSTDALQEWSYASNFVDTSVETMTGALKKLTVNMKSSSKETVAAFDALGVSTTDASGNMRDAEDVFWDAIDALGQIENETERDQLAMQLFGKSAQELNPLIEAGSAEFKRLGEEAHSMGVVMSEDALKSMGQFDDSMQRAKAAASGLKTAIGAELIPVFQPLVDTAADTMAEFSKAIQDGLDPEELGEIIDKLMDQLGDAIDSSAGVISDAMPVISAALSTLAGKLAENLPEMMDTLIGAASDIVTSIATAIGENIGPLADTAATLLTSLVGFITDELPTLVEAAVSIMARLAVELVKAIPDLIKAIPDIFKGIVDAFAEMDWAQIGADVLAALKESFDAIWTDLKSIGSKIWSTIKEAAPEFTSWAQDKWTKIRDAVSSGWETVKSTLEVYGPVIWDLITEYAPEFAAWASERWQAITGALSDAWDSVKATFSDFGKNIITAIGESFTDLSGWITALKQGLANTIDAAITAVKLWWNSIVDKVFGEGWQFDIFGKHYEINLGDNLKFKIDEDPAEEAIDSAVDAAASNADASGAGSEVGEDFVTGFGEAVGGGGMATKVNGEVGGLGRQSKQTATSSGEDVGKNIDRGIAAGIDKNTNYIKDAVRKAIKEAKQAAETYAGIASPSKLFRDSVGRYISEGIGAGITDGISSITGAVRGAISAAAGVTAPSFGYSMAAAGAAAGGYAGQTFAITQNIYADTTDYASQQAQAARQFRDIARRI